MKLGIMSAMKEEIDDLVAEMGPGAQVVRAGLRTYHVGSLWGTPAVLVFSRWGKVAAAAAATTLITRFGVDRILFTGVAGAVDPWLRVGDVVVADQLYQHDMDARPLFARHQVPLLGLSAFPTHCGFRRAAAAAAEQFLAQDLRDEVGAEILAEFGIARPRVVAGDIASGDRFLARSEDRRRLRERLPTTLCVEMEGAAVAQVCYEHGLPCTVIRTISDGADESAPGDFARFVWRVAGPYTRGILRHLLAGRPRPTPSGKGMTPAARDHRSRPPVRLAGAGTDEPSLWTG